MDGDHGMPRIGGIGDDVLNIADLVDEEPAVEEDEGYVLQERNRYSEIKEKENKSLAPLGARRRGLLG